MTSGAMMPLVLGAMAIAGIATPLLTRRLGRNTGYVLATVFAGAAGAFGAIAPSITSGEALRLDLPWIPRLGISMVFVLDGLALLFAIVILGIGALVLAYTARYLRSDERGTRMYTLLVFFAASMLGLVLAGDAILLVVFWELTSITSFLLIGGRGDQGARPARVALLVTSMGGLALFAGLVLMTVAAGTSDLQEILRDPAAVRDHASVWAIMALVCAGAFTKSAQFPFHFWLPGAMVAPTPVSTYLHAATMVKAGIYLLARMSPVFAGMDPWLYVLVGTGLATTLIAAVLALKQHDLKALLAYSTVSQLGFLTMLIGFGTPAAIGAAVVLTIAHACYKATLFMVAGIIDRQAGSRDIRALSGLRKAMPLTAAVTGLAVLSMAGLPPLLGFVSKEEAFAAIIDSSGPAWLVPLAVSLAAAALAMTFAAGARILDGAFGGPLVDRPPRPPHTFLAPAALTAGVGLGLGLTVGVLDPLAQSITRDFAEPSIGNLSLWHGLTPALGVSVATITIGLALFWRRRTVDSVLGSVAAPLDGQVTFERAYDGLARLGSAVARPFVVASPAIHLSWVLGGLAAGGVIFFLSADVGRASAPASRPQDWIVTALLAAAVVGIVRSTTRLGAVALTGLAGFLLALLYVLLGAPDLALTQLLVETLTVTLVVLVFRRLPETFHPTPRWRRVGSTTVALGMGGLAAAGTFLLTGRRGSSEVGAYFLEAAERETGGKNVVNTILVDFRALDTLGEVTVLGVVALGVAAVAGLRRGTGRTSGEPIRGVDTLIVRGTSQVIVPGIFVASLYLLYRGHNAPGGGFIAALAAGAAIVLRYIAAGTEGVRRLVPVQFGTILGTGLALCAGAGVAALAFGGSFLEGTLWRLDLGFSQLKIASSLIFDVGVYLIVLAMVVAVIRTLGGEADPGGDPEPTDGSRDDGRVAV